MWIMFRVETVPVSVTNVLKILFICSNLKMDYSVKNLTLLVKFGQKEVECLLFSKKWNGVSIFKTKMCQV
jgi:hypothetical protein